jgi:hypothetical protein
MRKEKPETKNQPKTHFHSAPVFQCADDFRTMDDPHRELFKFLSVYAHKDPDTTISMPKAFRLTSQGPFPPPTRFVRRRSSASVRLRKVALAPEHQCTPAEPTSSDSATPDTTSPLYGKTFDFDFAYEQLETDHCMRCDRGGHEATP